MDDTLKARYVQRQACHKKSFVKNHVDKMLQVSPFFINNGALFEKDNLLLPAAFFEKKKNNHKQGRLAEIQFVSFILKN